MPRGGYRPGSGRRPRCADGADTAPRSPDISPLEYMLAVMRDPAADPVRRDRMAATAAPYCHPRAAEIGKKVKAARAAETAGQGSRWGDDLNSPLLPDLN